MPELPEAESIARALDRALVGETIAKVEVFFPRLRTPLTPLLSAHLEGRRIVSVKRRARYAVAELDDGRDLVMHFGMSGVVRVEGSEVPRRKHEHVFIHFANGRIFRFEDPRRFGSLEVQEKGEDGWPKGLAAIGVEPLGTKFTGDFLYRAAQRSRKPVKELIMDNALVTGIGNIYAAESLYAARLAPTHPANTLTFAECRTLVRHIRRILRTAIKWGGTTVSDFRNVDGSEGKFAQKLRCYAQKRCPRCHGPITTVQLGGRTSWYCPACQR